MSEGKWFEGLGGGRNYLSTALGNEVILTVKEINKITEKTDYEPKNKEGKTQGFLFEFVGDEGVVTVSTFALQTALVNAQVDVGDVIKITHPNHGTYVVEKLN
jgi:hypothetical protein